MTDDQLAIIGIAAGCATSVGVVGLVFARALRGASLRWLPAGVALVASAAVIAAVVGTARAMFISDHDYVVVLWVCLVAGIVSACFASLVGAVVVRSSRQLHEGARRFGESGRYDAEVTGPAEFTALNAGAHGDLPQARRGSRKGATTGGFAPRAGLLGLPRSPHSALGSPRHDRGPRGRNG